MNVVDQPGKVCEIGDGNKESINKVASDDVSTRGYAHKDAEPIVEGTLRMFTWPKG